MGRLILFSQILILWFLLLHFQVECSAFSPNSPQHLCHPQEHFALLDFNTTISAENYDFCGRTIQTWNESVDCCLWEGITCSKMTGHVVGLDLSDSCIAANLTTNSSLFRLENLQSLNFAYNDLSYPNMSFGFHIWKSLTYLNLTGTYLFHDSILFEISLLPKLVSLDLSENYGLQFQSTTFQMLVHNLTELRFLILDSLNMPPVVPSSLLNLTSSLEHLSLQHSDLWGNFPNQVFQLPSLQLLDLSDNYFLGGNLPESNWSSTLEYLNLAGTNFSGELSHSIGNLKLLKYLNLAETNLLGELPHSIGNLKLLKYLNLAETNFSGELPHSIGNLKLLEYLDLAKTNFSGELPHSIGNLKLLKELDLDDSQFCGSIPRSLANLTEITYLCFSSNHLQGQIPDVFGKMHKLTNLSFAANNFGGEIPKSIFNLTHLTFLSLSSNNLIGSLPHNISGLSFLLEFQMNNNFITGCVPSWLFSLPSLSLLDLKNNRLTRPIDHIEMPSRTLEEVYLSNNEISGSIPSFFFDLVNLTTIDLSSNNLSGTITPNMLSKLVHLWYLDFSNNSLLSLSNNGTGVNYSFPRLWYLRFSSCNIHKFPSFLRKVESLQWLDISKNKISGQIHKWEIEGMSLASLNLSYNFLTSINLFAFGYLETIDLKSNLLQGSLPILPTISYTGQNLFISGNNLTGGIPSSYCNLTSLQVLDLANNSLGGKIPECLGNLSDLYILDLRMNKFHGIIPNSFVNGNELRTLNLNGNQLEGILPRSLVNCSNLEVLDVGNNYLNDTFPHWLGVLPRLQVLILRFNRFHGAINNSMPAFYFPGLRIIDISQNNFMGLLPRNYFKILKGMRDIHGYEAKLGLGYIGEYIGVFSIYYGDSVKLVVKGLEVELVRILTIFTTIDFSSNQFHGPIPEELGELNSLLLLNLSHNSLTGQIPSSLGKMTELESLDLSSNKLDGRIPKQLTSLTFLSVLNLSQNKLEGDIPQGQQFNTFSNDSYIGNSGLCGFPLTKKCHTKEDPKFDEDDDSATLFNWKFAMAGYGCGLVLGLSLGYIVFTTGKPWWMVKKVEKYQQKFLGSCTRRHKKRKTQKPNQRS